jgi:phosphohistidine swiveling domain-containing protein
MLVAVRSSATAEDSASAAWAGQLESFLNTDRKHLLENVQKCWASLYTPRAIFYGFEKGFHGSGQRQRTNDQGYLSVAVVVQQMVQSEISGIAFSVHPVTQDTNQLIIEAGYGLGEAIVSGQITPDSYVVTKEPVEITDKNISAQDRMLIRANKGGNEWVTVDSSQANNAKLSDQQILELSRLIIKIESHYGFPCDIEWAFANDQFYITQSRPITTLYGSMNEKPAVYQKFFSRDFCLASVEAWVRGESTNPKEWTQLTQPFLPYIITERADDTVHFWYDVRGVAWVQDLLVKIAKEESDFLYKLEQTVLHKLEYIRPIYEQQRVLELPELKRFIQELEAGYPWFEAMWWYCQMDESKLVGLHVENIQKVRALTDTLCNASDTVIRTSLAQAYPELGDLSAELSTQEILSGTVPTRAELEQRQAQYFFANNQLYVGVTPQQIEMQLSVKFELAPVDSTEALTGQVAERGVVRGRVRRVMGHKQISILLEGEIMVSPMTIPDFLPAMKKAAAIVTDEGGVVCHAAIVARELHTPCVVGTKVATQVLRDGDLVEVDANNGVVRVIERAVRSEA